MSHGREMFVDTRIGISGWRYEPWRKTFYPPGLPQAKELAFASRMVNSIELNGTFYSLQTPASFQSWYLATPADFKFSVKGPRYITHIRRLKDAAAPLGNFFASGVLHLREKLGPFLWQLPPNFLFRDDVIEDFFKRLPPNVGEAVKLATHADRVEPDWPASAINSKFRLRHALEVRHDSFLNPDFISLLRKYKVALVFADTAGNWPYMEDLTADFVYLRLHGEAELYASGYPEESLKWWSERIKCWRRGSQVKDAVTMSEDKPRKLKSRDAYIYFDNDVKVHAPFNAQTLLSLLTNYKLRDSANWRRWINESLT